MKSCNLSKWSEDRSLVMKYQWLIEESLSIATSTPSIDNSRKTFNRSFWTTYQLIVQEYYQSIILAIDNQQLTVTSQVKDKRAHGLMWQMLHQFWKLNQKHFSQILRTSKPTNSGKATRISSCQMLYQVEEILHLY